jgi:hypothetical protein
MNIFLMGTNIGIMKMTDEKLFDTKHISDLPSEVREEITPLRIHSTSRSILTLFDIKPVLTANEILVGLSRKFCISKKKSNVTSLMKKLVTNKMVKKIDISTWSKC